MSNTFFSFFSDFFLSSRLPNFKRDYTQEGFFTKFVENMYYQKKKKQTLYMAFTLFCLAFGKSLLVVNAE